MEAATPGNVNGEQVKFIEAKLKLERAAREGANWFFWIAGLSLVNSIVQMAGGRWTFFVGLGATQFVDGFAKAFAADVGPEFATVVRIVALVINTGIAAVFAIWGFFARKGHKWSFIVGMILYALDGLIFLMVKDFWGAGFHLFVLFWINAGLRANSRLREIKPGEPLFPSRWHSSGQSHGQFYRTRIVLVAAIVLVLVLFCIIWALFYR